MKKDIDQVLDLIRQLIKIGVSPDIAASLAINFTLEKTVDINV